MRIVIDCCNYFLDNHNHGDRAVYQAVSSRLLELWPDAEIHWITLDPDLMRQTVPQAEMFVLRQRHHWQLVTRPPKAAFSGMPDWLLPLVNWLFLTYEQKKMLRAIPDAQQLFSLICTADLVLALGGGAFSDHFPEHACGLLDTLALGVVCGKPAALLSVGFEPLRTEALIKKCGQVFPALSLIGCREARMGPPYLKSMGAAPSQIYMTGDAAIDLAYRLHSSGLGNAIGVNLRQSEYSGVDEPVSAAMRLVLQQQAARYQAPLLGCPISMFGPSDVQSVEKLIDGYPGLSESGSGLATPEQVIGQVGRCRLVVTGSYHSAVFALAQGIPAITVARSGHYLHKLTGLAEQFGEGCWVLDPASPEFPVVLGNAISTAWVQAPAWKERLLQKAGFLVAESDRAYEKLFTLVSPV